EIVVGNLRPSSGSVYFNGAEIEGLGKKYRDKLGYLPQNFSTGFSVTVYEYLEYMAVLKGVPKKSRDKKIKQLIANLHLEDYVHRRVDKLSGGTLQRVGIAQTLLNNPEIVVLDEPTSGLDPNERIYLRNLISKIGKKQIVIFSTHIVSDIESVSNMNMIIDKGRLIQCGTTEAFLSKISNKIYQIEMPEEKITIFEKKFKVISIQNTKKGSGIIRFISENEPNDRMQLQRPKLEDYYFYVLNEEKEEQIMGKSKRYQF
ncbi:MAG: ATP-binding cassette domain-containing protein, partial [Eubacterium sp.]